MKFLLSVLTLWMLVPVVCPAQDQPAVYDSLTDRTLSRQEMQDDLQYLRKVMEAVHPGLYRYTPRPVMDQRLDSFYDRLTGSLPFYDYYRSMASLVAGVRCAHTSILPGRNWESHFMRNVPLFPYSLHFIKDRAYIILNQTADTTLKPGFELLAINGQSITDIRQVIFDHSWSDGYNTTNKQQRLNQGMFAILYYLSVGRPTQFELTCKDFSGQTIQVKTPAMTMTTSSANFRQNPVNKDILRMYVNRKRDDLELDIKKDHNAALLTIRTFGGAAAGKISSFLPKAMKELEKKQIRHLVIDLRSNGGGWDSAGVILFTYLINKPSRYYVRQHAITDTSQYLALSDLSPEDLKNVKNELVGEKDGTFSLKESAAAGLSLQVPKPQHFTGKVYFIMNGASASTTSEFLAAAHANQLGVFIGEEDGGNYAGGNGGSFIGLVLPNSKIKISIPLFVL
ncbi:S41 family peptidase [Paraflavitalea speifideaquila]|uniref:S41 family peptidase n=1 Tax=Paraflavitalea speifideaquila TaxID=3076558 RepID=UPI0028ED4785|nr:S41 family peptidase [Paraflavitalea speifideiaquila]